MKLKMNLNSFLIVLAFSAIGPLFGQVVYDLNFQGVLNDIEGNRIINESFILSVQMKRVSESETLFEFSSVTLTDEEGWFGFNISEISRFMKEGEPFADPVSILMEFTPDENTSWLKKNEVFKLSYTLSSRQTQSFEMTRMEGSELMLHSEDHLYAFKDKYPFAQVTGGFLLTDQPPLSADLISNLKQWILPEEGEDAGAASRGVKGGFPTGGYYKKK